MSFFIFRSDMINEIDTQPEVIYRCSVTTSFYQFFLVVSFESFDCEFPPQGGRTIIDELGINEFDRQPRTSVSGSASGIMQINTIFHVLCDACVQATVGTAHDIDSPHDQSHRGGG